MLVQTTGLQLIGLVQLAQSKSDFCEENVMCSYVAFLALVATYFLSSRCWMLLGIPVCFFFSCGFKDIFLVTSLKEQGIKGFRSWKHRSGKGDYFSAF